MKDTVSGSDIEQYWISCGTHLSRIKGDCIRKRIDTSILNK